MSEPITIEMCNDALKVLNVELRAVAYNLVKISHELQLTTEAHEERVKHDAFNRMIEGITKEAK